MTIEHYPPAPAVVPEGLTAPPPSYRRKVWLAVAGLLGFVAVYAALTGWFAHQAWKLFGVGMEGGPDAWMSFIGAVVAAFLAVFLGKAMFFVRSHADRGLIEITEADEPRLFAFLRRLAAETGAKAPYRVYLSPRVNAAVFYDLSPINLLIPSRKNLEIGLGLVNVLSLAEFKAVLAHELGHFAQRSMAVGRWVYISQQVVGHIVAKRDGFDRFLIGVSNIDIRVAWIGWGLRLIVWSIRSVLDSLFSVIVLAERALSREMELQADLVSVSVSGSDALVHALRKLPPADAAWDRALDVYAGELREGRQAPDLCALQDRVLAHTRRLLGDPHYGQAPPLPEGDRAAHRIFSSGLCQPPQMWSTHPPNHVREDNAKRRYVAAEFDAQPAWRLFGDPDAVRRKIADKVAELVGKPDKLEQVDTGPALAAIDRKYERLHLDSRYRGVYLGRSVTRGVQKPGELCPPLADAATDIQAQLESLYPESLSERVTTARAQAGEVAQLEAIRRGVATAPGGVLRYGGCEFRRRELDDVIKAAKRDHEATLAALHEHDRTSRQIHHAAAEQLGRSWPAYLEGLRALLHYAEHTEANVDDAAGHLSNTWQIVTADGKVSESEAARLMGSGHALQFLLNTVYEQRRSVTLPPAVAAKLEVESWQAALPETFKLPPPDRENLASFMEVVDGWFSAFSGALGALRMATLDELLSAEAHVARALRSDEDPGDAPAPARVPRNYEGFLFGQERERQHKLDWWDRFMLADGLGPGLARLAIAGAVVGMVLGFGATVGSPTVVIHNGLGREVVVEIGGQRIGVMAHGREEVQVEASAQLHVRAFTTDNKPIELFTAEASSAAVDYLYNVGGASPLVEWEAVYGYKQQPEPRHLGAPRWLATDADDILREPPESVRGKGGARREVITAIDDGSPLVVTGPLEQAERDRVTLFHARWEPADGPEAKWLLHATGLPGFPEVLRERRADDDRSVLLGRLEQDTADDAARAEVCERHAATAAAEPSNVDATYLAIRCVADEAQRDARFAELHARHPEHPWLTQAAAYTHIERDEFEQAIAMLEEASRALPAMAEDNAVVLARLRRRVAPDEDVELGPLLERSPILRFLVTTEKGEEPELAAYHTLNTGLIDPAFQQAKSEQRARVLRLAAASDGADPTLRDAVIKLGPDEGIDGATIWTAIAFAAAHELDASPWIERLRRDGGEKAEELLRFASRERLLADLPAAQAALRTLHPEQRGHAAVMGIITLRAEAPAEWRLDARKLLFATERPFFAERVEPPAPAPVAEPEPPKRGRTRKPK
ncbi:M48 family metallopeptidase [Nannocystis punicea]|uniref:M48 family metallopeptidase n=1 Tax=Nannocystis punicea TaxID=2995304 RepID=A0ABY7GXB7_9BACT|nr:M48 family metallopeptidase [Nannocystis poenicansa]WAS91520.1 M48 family metallopeptidase [Nannocystis poenicansa]